MKQSKLITAFSGLIEPQSFKLAEFDPADTAGFKKTEAKTIVQSARRASRAEFAGAALRRGPRAVLLILQGVDAAGKDGVIEHVMAGLNPQGCAVFPFKAPPAEELEHDFLWRTVNRLPCRRRHRDLQSLVLRGRAGGARARDLLEAGFRRPVRTSGSSASRTSTRSSGIWRNGTVVVKFFLHISKEEQKQPIARAARRARQALEVRPRRRGERKQWDDYMDAYEDMIRNTARRKHRGTWSRPITNGSRGWWSPRVLVDVLDRLDLKYPTFDAAALGKMKQIRKALKAD